MDIHIPGNDTLVFEKVDHDGPHAILPKLLVILSFFSMLAALGFNYYAQALMKSAKGSPGGTSPLKFLGFEQGRFGYRRAQIKSFKEVRDVILDGYNRLSAHGEPFLVALFGREPWVVLPSSVLKEISSKPESVVDPREVRLDLMATKYLNSNPKVLAPNFPHNVVRLQLTRHLADIVDDVADEMSCALQDQWGTDRDSWRSVSLYAAVMKIIGRSINRAFTQSPELYRNPAFLRASENFAQSRLRNAVVMNLVPEWLRTPLAVPLTYGYRRHLRTCQRYCVPVIEERTRHTIKKLQDRNYDWEPMHDALQYFIDESLAQEDPEMRDPYIMTERLMMMNMVAVHSTSMSLINTILDLNSSPDSAAYIERLRQEGAEARAGAGGNFNRVSLTQLVFLDSTIKESMRLSDLLAVNVNRKIVDPAGLTLKDGLHLPFGTQICFPSSSVHHDPSIFAEPNKYNAFRYVEDEIQQGMIDPATNKKRVYSNKSLVRLSEDFLAFGHGKRACSGRFFAAQQMKLFLSYVVENYNIEPLAERPQNFSGFGSSIPMPNVEIRVRRR
ncbi:Uu.00g131110.m01.CDS01 [Anthostomella pinea]|uniref:Uu.00g131110.m01.CDS01 n=1 Tax=Anthostomella pinea TaxID=933095 RepID=A0AAI8YIC8_9PEZI|nr:Uu.00g131110.m01.CDS01 [Anthostomella pinea]